MNRAQRIVDNVLVAHRWVLVNVLVNRTDEKYKGEKAYVYKLGAGDYKTVYPDGSADLCQRRRDYDQLVFRPGWDVMLADKPMATPMSRVKLDMPPSLGVLFFRAVKGTCAKVIRSLWRQA